ncbi:low-specificity L-threonine aldolase [Fodinisporobacter ferrooxydans]|uniref:Low-specificity L-threonine aldolase n=1 Tax=Fodinisporobacter ferrooxydans TaxID=2901836 RepID=A0ABY4CHF5_9BACL|nr:low-specificity L-threonine aldolase [Alicyclobacillaceae bacterium MYW30-H2]
MLIDLRSDTVTKPTAAMRKAMADAEVGDDVYKEDPTVNRLEELAADMLGKEAALFVTSGTQGNQIAVLTHTAPGQEILLEAESHIFYYEAGAVAALAGVQTRTIPGIRGAMEPKLVEAAIRGEDIHFPATALLCLENTHNRAGGAVLPLSYMAVLYDLAKRRHVAVHMDGARLFNAAVALGVDVRAIAEHVDTVQICLSKGLGAPVGSILAGPKVWIAKARKWRKRLGGGMRQAGVIAAPGILALTEMVERLAEDHAHAKQLAYALAEMKGITIRPEHIETNIVIFDVAKTGRSADECVVALKNEGILATSFGPTCIRLVTHKDIGQQDIETAIHRMNNIFSQ